MPLRDHFRPPLDLRRSWDELHGGWPMMIVQRLAGILPAGYAAAPGVHMGAAFEVDVSAYEMDEPEAGGEMAADGGGDCGLNGSGPHPDSGNRPAGAG